MDLEVMVFSHLEISGKISACENIAASTMLTGSTVSDLSRSFEGSSATPRPASSVRNGGGKNSVRCLRRNGSPNLLRPQGPSLPGSALRRHAGVLGDPEQAGPCGRRRFGEPCRRRRTEFFPPPFETEDTGLGVTEDSSDGRDRSEAGEPIGVMEATVFSHAEILPDISR